MKDRMINYNSPSHGDVTNKSRLREVGFFFGSLKIYS
jgi:hypothetical protein